MEYYCPWTNMVIFCALAESVQTDVLNTQSDTSKPIDDSSLILTKFKKGTPSNGTYKESLSVFSTHAVSKLFLFRFLFYCFLIN